MWRNFTCHPTSVLHDLLETTSASVSCGNTAVIQFSCWNSAHKKWIEYGTKLAWSTETAMTGMKKVQVLSRRARFRCGNELSAANWLIPLSSFFHANACSRCCKTEQTLEKR